MSDSMSNAPLNSTSDDHTGCVWPSGWVGKLRPAWLGLALILMLTLGCERIGTKRTAISRQPPRDRTPPSIDEPATIPIPAPEEPESIEEPGEESPSETDETAALTEERPGNPEQWGQGSQMSVGREFDPIFFEEGSAELNGPATRQLSEYARWLKTRSHVWLTLAGHCDGSDTLEYAYNLGMARALTVEDYLVGQGVERGRIYSISYGQDRPAELDPSPQGEQLNSRVEILAFLAPPEQETPTPIKLEKEAPSAEEAPRASEGEDIR